jgi:hypothetical protein
VPPSLTPVLSTVASLLLILYSCTYSVTQLSWDAGNDSTQASSLEFRLPEDVRVFEPGGGVV